MEMHWKVTWSIPGTTTTYNNKGVAIKQAGRQLKPKGSDSS